MHLDGGEISVGLYNAAANVIAPATEAVICEVVNHASPAQAMQVIGDASHLTEPADTSNEDYVRSWIDRTTDFGWLHVCIETTVRWSRAAPGATLGLALRFDCTVGARR